MANTRDIPGLFREIHTLDQSPTKNHELRRFNLRLSPAILASRSREGEVMQAFGSLLFMWGGLDWFMSFQEVDVYYDWFGIYLPDAIYNYSHWIAMGLGSIIFAAGNQSK